jgi:hypothetical protein
LDKDNLGTSFAAAFTAAERAISKYATSSDVMSLTIMFMTDGCDSTTDTTAGRIKLATTFKKSLEKKWKKQYTVHSLGFAKAHDKEFLDALRKIGTTEGAYRYAEPRSDSDELSAKLFSILNVIRKAPTIPMRIVTAPFPILQMNHNSKLLVS